MTFDDFMRNVRDNFSDYIVDQTPDGELVIYTGKKTVTSVAENGENVVEVIDYEDWKS